MLDKHSLEKGGDGVSLEVSELVNLLRRELFKGSTLLPFRVEVLDNSCPLVYVTTILELQERNFELRLEICLLSSNNSILKSFSSNTQEHILWVKIHMNINSLLLKIICHLAYLHKDITDLL